MYFRRPKIYMDNSMKIAFFFAATLAVLALIIYNSFKIIEKNNIDNNVKNNVFYAQIVNYAIPLVKTTTFDEADMAESQFSIRDIFLQSIGVNIDSPLKLMAREVAYFSILNPPAKSETSGKVGFSFNPFNLEESDIFRQEGQKLPQKETGNEEGGQKATEDDPSLPNRIANVYDPKLKTELNPAKPQVLIYHTHTTESFDSYGMDNDDNDKNINAVGAELKSELEKNYGIAVIHDSTVHNKPYVGCYDRSKKTLDGYLKKYGDFKLIIDMHRDSVSVKNSVTTKLNGKNAAKIMFVMSTGNPRFKQNQTVVNKLLDISKGLFPGLDRGIYYYNNKNSHFNADRSNNAVLIEVGSVINTLDEAKESVKYLGRIIGEYINGKR
jgi:stage II sporulation protein P